MSTKPSIPGILLSSVPRTLGPQGRTFCLACKGGHTKKARDAGLFIKEAFKDNTWQLSVSESGTLSSTHTSCPDLSSEGGGSPKKLRQMELTGHSIIRQ